MALTIPDAERSRLQQLCDTAGRELTHLRQTTVRLFASGFSPAQLAVLCEDIDFSERLDAFVARFGRLQDLLGDKYLPAWLRAVQETPASLLENLDRAEKLGLIRNADEWVALRKLRNRMIHEYLWQHEDLHGALYAAQDGVAALAYAVEQLGRQVEKLVPAERPGQ